MSVKKVFIVVIRCFCFDFKKFEQKINFKNVVFVLRPACSRCAFDSTRGIISAYLYVCFLVFSCFFDCWFFNGVV